MKIKMKTRPRRSIPGQDCSPPDQAAGLGVSCGRGASLGSGRSGPPASGSGFTLIETLVAICIAAIVLPTIYASLATGFALIKTSREDQRATQVILQRMEAIRLSPYQTLQSPAAYPTNATEYYSESGKVTGNGGVPYTVTFSCAPGPSSLPPSYRTNVLLVTVGASWKSGNVQRTRSMQTYVSRYGIRRYVCGN